jgi:GFO/IDH/MocA oxidoreductase family protein/biliverdin reductase-like protein
MGSAGRARLKAVSEVKGMVLAALVSRRPGVGDRSLEAVLADPAIHAVAISTENTDHPSSVRKCLEAGKHVLCDYPLAFGEETARDLYELAKTKDRILHVEHLGILMLAHRLFKEQIPSLGGLIEGEFTFTANWNESLRDEGRQGPFPFLAESRLVQLTDLFGDFEVRNAAWYAREDEARLTLDMHFKKGGVIHFIERRTPHASRERSLRARFGKGEFAWPGVVEPTGLFAKDLAHFRDRILHGHPNYYDEGLMMEVLGVLEGISKSKV